MSARVRILVVDDDEGIRRSLVAILEGEGYVVDTAKNGKEAIKKSNVDFYNLALIDVRLPDMEGTELLSTMKETTPKMVKIIVTGYPDLENAIEAVNKSADAYITKPFSVDNLLKIIKDHLKKQEKTQKYDEEKVVNFIETRVKEWEEKRTVSRKKHS
jgi:DNA-binding NtrC family response regulator